MIAHLNDIAALVLCRAGCEGGHFETEDGVVSVCVACRGTGIDRGSWDGCLCGEEHEHEGAVIRIGDGGGSFTPAGA